MQVGVLSVAVVRLAEADYLRVGDRQQLYYTAGDDDEELLAITDSKVVRFGQANHGD